MTSVQGDKILADVRTDRFHSEPLRPGNQHTSTPLTDNQLNMFRWQQRRRVEVSEGLSQRGLSWSVFNVNQAGLRVYCHLKKSHRHWTYTWTQKQQNQIVNWGGLVVHLREDSNSLRHHFVVSPASSISVRMRWFCNAFYVMRLLMK